MSVGESSLSRPRRSSKPAASLPTLQRSPLGRSATSRWSLETSMPQKRELAALIAIPPAGDIRACDRLGPALRDADFRVRATVRAQSTIGITGAAPKLNHGLSRTTGMTGCRTLQTGTIYTAFEIQGIRA